MLFFNNLLVLGGYYSLANGIDFMDYGYKSCCIKEYYIKMANAHRVKEQ